MPSFSTYMKFAVTLPSSPFGPARNTAAPGFSRLLSPGTGARIGTSGPILYSDSPSLNLTCTTLPCGASVTVPTVALVNHAVRAEIPRELPAAIGLRLRENPDFYRMQLAVRAFHAGGGQEVAGLDQD